MSAAGMFAGIMMLFFLAWIVFMAIAVLGTIFWIFMIVDVAKRTFKNESDKVLWILIVVLAGLIGAIIYYFVVKKKDRK
jgi:hypothetical protein